MMRTALFFLIIGLGACTLCKAQDMTATAQPRFCHHEFSVSYGTLPITDAFSMCEEWFVPVATFGLYARENTSHYGALNISYTYRFNRKISLGVTGGITGNKGTANSLYEPLDKNIKDNRRYLYILPTFRWHWFNRPKFSLYSSAGLGAYFLRNRFGEEVFHKTHFACQFNYLGIECGSRFVFFMEFGVGYAGTIATGGRYRF